MAFSESRAFEETSEIRLCFSRCLKNSSSRTFCLQKANSNYTRVNKIAVRYVLETHNNSYPGDKTASLRALVEERIFFTLRINSSCCHSQNDWCQQGDHLIQCHPAQGGSPRVSWPGSCLELQEWKLYNLSGQPMPVFTHPHGKKVFPDIQREPHVLQTHCLWSFHWALHT